MAKKKKSTEDEGEQKKGGKRKLVVVAVLILGLAYQFVLKKPASTDGELAAAGAPTTIAEGEYVEVPAVTLNLAGDGGHYLKYHITLVLKKGVPVGEVEPRVSLALDISNDVLSARTIGDLQADGARDALKQELSERISEAFEGDVVRVLLPELTWQ